MAFKRSQKKTSYSPNNDIFNEDILKPGEMSNTIKTTIGVAGCMYRIGTTTIATQLALFLIFSGKKAVYVEANNTDFIDELLHVYADVKPDGSGNVDYDILKLVKRDNIQTVMNKDVEYLIFDYGSVFSPSFDSSSFSERNVQILIGGSSPKEQLFMTEALKNPLFKKCWVFYNLVPEYDQKAILKRMTSRAEKTKFTAYMPDYFKSEKSMDNIFTTVLPDLKK